MSERIHIKKTDRLVSELERMLCDGRRVDAERMLALLPTQHDPCEPGQSIQAVLEQAATVELVQICIDLGADPFCANSIPPFYTVRSDAAAQYLKPLTLMLVKNGVQNLHNRWGKLRCSIFDEDPNPEAVEYFFLGGIQNGLALKQALAEVVHPTSAREDGFDLDGVLRLSCVNSVDHARGMIDLGVDPLAVDRHDRSSIFECPNADVVAYLCGLGVDPNSRDMHQRTALHFKCMHLNSFWDNGEHDLDGIDVLIAAGADVNAKDCFGNTPLHYAETAEVVRRLIDAGANVKSRNENASTPLHMRKDPASVRMLLERSADPNARDAKGNTPLYYVDLYHHPKCIRLLIDAGADVTSLNYNGQGLLHRVSGHWPQCVEPFLDAGYDPLSSAHYAEGQTMLHHMIECGSTCALVHRVLDLGVDINAQDEHGDTVLHYLARGYRPKQLHWLIQRKANPLIANSTGLLPIDVARCEEGKEILGAYMRRLERRMLKQKVAGMGLAKSKGAKRRM